MSVNLSGNQTDYSYTRESGKLVIRENSSGDIAYESPNNFTVTFGDGSTVDLSLSFDNQIASSSSLFFSSPSCTVLTGPSGGYALVWEQYGLQDDDPGEGLTLMHYDATGKLLKETKLVSGEAEDPCVTAMADGGYIVAWSNESSIVMQKFTSAGIATSTPKTVATRSNSSQELGDTNVTLLPDNKYVVSWVSSIEDGENETGDLYVQLYSAAGSKIGNPQKVNPSTISNSTPADQHILPDGSGGYLIAYTHEKITSEQWIPDEFTPGGGSYVREYESELLIRSYSANGLPNSTPQLLYSLNTNYPNATYYSLIKTTDGFLATWVASAQTGEVFGRTLIAQKFDSSFNEIGDEIIVVPVAQPNANDASLTQLADGSYLAVWSTFVGYGEANTTYAQRLNADLSANGEKITICETSSASYEAVATALPDGGFIITWNSGDADSFGDAGSSLFSQRYDAQGNPVGNARPLIEGGESDDSLTWTDSEDVTLIGGNGEDILSGNTGNDLLDGGNGNDIAHYSGNSGNYTLSLNDDGELTVSANNQTDTLRNIEQLRFTDITLSIGDGTLAIENSEVIGSETPKVATLKDGSQVIVWVGENGLNLERYKGYERLNSESIQDLVGAENPSITALEDGFIITWESFSTDGLGGFSSSLLSQRFASDLNPLEAPITIHSSDGDVYFSEPNAIALTTGGYALAWCEEKSIWTDSNSNGWMDDGEVEGTAKVYVQLTDTEGQAGIPILVSSSKDAIWAFEPSITALPGGGFAVVWEHEDDSTDAEEIFLQRFDASGNKLGGAIQVNTSKSGDQGDPDITTLTDGSIVVTWSRETHNSDDAISNSNIFMQRFSASGTKLGTETKVNAIDGIYGDPAITALTGGGYVVTWATSDEASSSGRTLYAQVFDKSGVKVGSEIVAAQSQTNMVPDIAPTADGGFLITWDSIAQDDFGYAPNGDIFAKRFDANGNSLTLTGDDSDNTLNWSGTNGVTLAGGAGDDSLTGGDASDSLVGGAGNDTLNGGKGADMLIGGEGDDIYVVDNAKDVITETDADDYDMVKSSVSWTLGANLEDLELTGSAAINGTGNELANVLIGNNAINTLTGGDGDDTLDGKGGADKLIGGKGNDTYIVDLTTTGTLQDTITELATTATYDGGVDTVVLRGTYDNAKAVALTVAPNTENLDASDTGASKLNLNGSAASNTLTGNVADNILDGKAGADTMKGGAGNDTYIIDNIDDEVIENTDEGNKDLVKVAIATVGGSYILSANVEEGMLTNTVAFRLEGNDLDNTLTGNAAANTLIGGAGNDILDGKAGADSMSGGLGDDIYFVDNTGDSVSEVDGDGTDEVRSTISFNLNDKGTDVENLTLIGSGAINATGNNLDNILTGNLAANILDGGLGADTMKGGKGNDTYIVGEGDSVIEEFTNAQGGGIDTVKSSITYTLGANLDHLTLTGSGDINATGNDLANTLTGNDGANQLDGGAGVDKLIGGKGDDTYTVDLTATGTLQDTITELADKPATTTVPAYVGGVDTVIVRGHYASDPSSTALAKTISVIANTENLDISLTGASKLNLNGSAANNILIGNDANNIIIGGAGADTMTGGAGADTFRFASLNDLGLGDGKQDVITDFISGQDKLDFKALAGWKLVAEGSVNGTKQLWTESYSVETDSGTETGLILKGNSTGDLTADFSIKLVGVTTLESTDLILV